MRPVAVEQVRNHPRFKYFREAGEDDYQSFLGVPLIDCGVLQGVLVVQTMQPRIFRDDEICMLVEAAAQVAPVISEARTLDRQPQNDLLITGARIGRRNERAQSFPIHERGRQATHILANSR